jgi:hypothetical protein
MGSGSGKLFFKQGSLYREVHNVFTSDLTREARPRKFFRDPGEGT